ncbi:hypothetical protein EIJ81_10180 [Aliivibrio salmonicida]|uniref:Outer membrane protein, OmpA family n=1 Tax=Aliivibrio salmonicida (strain LFI1238) TaxID=316275 RepID=B6EMK0_ALISL|nr:OmpA family protein [Aliivibrio salmonicida]AZL84927.1 hypothetical protein EIJ81_10180 [Aliivibrio salmonicida]CAQ79386.1 outer membrane protein, OmpA family [Aliivibrio salmonicida LFI1238]
MSYLHLWITFLFISFSQCSYATAELPTSTQSNINTEFSNSTLLPDNGDYWYVGTKLGLSVYQYGCEEWSIDCDRTDLGGGFFVGYQINESWGIELGKTFLGAAKAEYFSRKVTGDMETIDLFGKYTYGLTDRFGFFGKAGLANWNGKTKSDYVETTTFGHDLSVGFGAQYALNKRWLTQLEYQYINSIGDDTVGESDYHLMSIGIIYRFGFHELKQPFSCPIPNERQIITAYVDDELFDSNSTTITKPELLDPFIARLHYYSESTLSIIGHTDAIGSEAYNQSLSEKRAESVAKYFIKSGISNNRISTQGRGEKDPIAPNNTQNGRYLNRRVELRSNSFLYIPNKKLITQHQENN